MTSVPQTDPFSSQTFFRKRKKKTVLPQPPYSNSSHPLTSPPISVTGTSLAGSSLFQSGDEVKSASQADLKYMAKNGFQKCFDDLYE
ncbi:hypothetical protein TNCV_603501 [Trichonephila clavipes]|nr:hypothetical protein TNCV_603501 [Trichonephila clavipes]